MGTSPSAAKPDVFNDCAAEASPKKGSSNNAYKAVWHSSTLCIGGITIVLIFISVVTSLNYGSDTWLYMHYKTSFFSCFHGGFEYERQQRKYLSLGSRYG